MDRLTRRQLNRATLARQLLLERSAMPPLDALEHLVGLQAQEPGSPYVGLWSRLRGFDPLAYSELVARREVVRLGVMRATLHAVTARDGARLGAVMRPVMEQTFRGSAFAKALQGLELGQVVQAGRELLAEAPRDGRELRDALSARWPGYDPPSLAAAVHHFVPKIQQPPRGEWKRSKKVVWEPIETEPDASPDDVVLRYLTAFGPASAADVRAWSYLRGVRDVVDRLRPRLRVFRDERGRELLDVPDAPLPDPGTPAPVRFLPEFDNLLVAFDDRSRVIPPEHDQRVRHHLGRPPFLVDGEVRGFWSFDGERVGLDPFDPLTTADADALQAEAERLTAFLRSPRRP